MYVRFLLYKDCYRSSNLNVSNKFLDTFIVDLYLRYIRIYFDKYIFDKINYLIIMWKILSIFYKNINGVYKIIFRTFLHGYNIFINFLVKRKILLTPKNIE